MSIWGTFWPLKAKKWGKMGQNRCAWSGLHHIWLILMKSVLNEKVLFLQIIKVCGKKFPPFQRKNWFLAVFVILKKITKTTKNLFFLLKGGIFFWHTIIIWGNSTFSFSILFDLIKKSKKDTFCTLFWPKIALPSTLRAKKSVKYKFSWKVY